MLRSKIVIVCRTRAGRKNHVLKLSAGAAALALAGDLSSAALAGTYHATDDASLRAAIASAEGDADPSAAVILDNDVTLSNAILPGNTKPITIDTGSHTITSAYKNGSNVTGTVTLNGTPNGSTYIFNGTIQAAGAGAGAGGNGDFGLFSSGGKTITNHGAIVAGAGGGLGGNGGTGASLLGSAVLTTSGTIAGGGAANGTGGTGVALSSGASLSNSGTIRGGDGSGNGGIGVSAISVPNKTILNSGIIQGGNGTTASGGDGVRLIQGNGIDNSGTIIGGDGANGGWGVNITGLNAANPIFTNSGTIRGGNGTTGSGANGVIVHANVGLMTNSGSIIGGANSLAAIMNTGVLGATNAPVNLINSGAITAGAGSDTAILMNLPSNLTLELRKGSAITGKVVGNTGAAVNSLILGGDDNASFDVSAVGPQYQNFTSFQKTGNGVWSLTGTATAATPWTISAGTLQIGDGTATGSIISDVTDNAIFSFNRSDRVTFGNAISGTGSVTQAGNGTIILTGVNTYSGGTNLNAGTLSVAGDGALGDPAGALNFNGGILQVTGIGLSSTSRTISWGANGGGFDIADAGNAFTVGQTLAGGALTKLGAGTLVLTANDTFSGTTIGAGTLQVGAGGTAGSITGNVADNGTLVFDRSDAVTFGGSISGAGSVAQIAAGKLNLTGTNSYSGGTLISAGTVTGSTTSFGTGAITDNAALVISQPTDATFASAINGSGSFTKQGSGRLNYTGTGTLSGATTVTAGTLAVNGSLANSAVTVQSGASLGGNGTVGATTIRNGGTIAPGNSIGTLHINGAFTQSAGSVYQVEVDPGSNASDLIAVNGAATIQNGAGLNVVQNPAGQYQVGTVYKVLSATGGVSGTYGLNGQTTSASAFLGLKDSYDRNNVYLTVVETRDPATAATTPNQAATAQGVDSLPVTNPVVTAVLNSSSDTAARAAFDQLSGQVQASAQGALLANGLYVRDVAFDRLRDVVCVPRDAGAQGRCDGKKLSIWEQGFGGWGGIAGNGNAGGINHSLAGFLVGADVPVADWRLGFFGGYSHSDFHLAPGGAAGESTDYHLGAYGGTLLDNVALRLGASYSWNGINTNRAVLIGNFADALRGVYNGGTTQVFGELGYGMAMEKLSLEPFANLTYVGLTTSAFTEAGGPAALTVRGNTTENMIATLGLRPSMDMDLGEFGATLRGMLGWRHTFGTVTPDAQVSFAGGNVFSIGGVPIARDAAALEAGLDVALQEGMTIGVTYGGQFSGRSTDQTARSIIRFSF